jgi:hypothetical protein
MLCLCDSGKISFYFFDSIRWVSLCPLVIPLECILLEKKCFTWEFQFRLFVTGKELWGPIDGSNPSPAEPKELTKWKVKDAHVMS